MAEQKPRGTRRASKSNGRTESADEMLTKAPSTAGSAVSAVAEGTDTVDEVRKEGTDTVDEVRNEGQAAGALADSTTRDLAQESLRRDQPSVRDELAAAVRESAIEILAPVARSATKQAAGYAVKKGPQLVTQTIAPRVRDTLGSAIEEAGGPGELARGALSSAAERRSGLLSKVGIRRERGDGSQSGTESWRIPIEQSIDVAVPLETAYDQFDQYEELAKFMAQGERVDERPNERITWRTTDGMEAVGVITFHRLSDRLTRVMVTYDAQPHGIVEKASSALRVSSRALRSDLVRYKAFVEVNDEEDDDEGHEEDEYDTDEQAVADQEQEPTASRRQARTRQPGRPRPARQAGRRR